MYWLDPQMPTSPADKADWNQQLTRTQPEPPPWVAENPRLDISRKLESETELGF